MTAPERDRLLSGVAGRGGTGDDAPDPERIAAYLDGKLHPAEAAPVEAWLSNHPEMGRALDPASTELLPSGGRISEGRSNGGEDHVRERSGRFRRRATRIVVAASFVAAVGWLAAILMSRGDRTSRFAIETSGLVVAVRGDVSRTQPDGDGERVRFGEALRPGDGIRMRGRDAMLELFERGRHVRIRGREAEPASSVASDVVLSVGAVAGDPGASDDWLDRSEPDRGAVAMAPIGRVIPAGRAVPGRPSFELDREPPSGAIIELLGLTGDPWRFPAQGRETALPAGVPELERKAPYEWSLVSSQGEVLVRELFVIAGEGELESLQTRVRDIREGGLHEDVRDLLLMGLYRQLGFDREALEALEMLASRHPLSVLRGIVEPLFDLPSEQARVRSVLRPAAEDESGADGG